jgi:hypothetical protein
MKNARIEKKGSLEIDFGPAIRPSDEIDPNNPFMRKKEEIIATIRSCKICGKRFLLHGDYDSKNELHDLCDDHILDLPGDDQKYPKKSLQIEQNDLDAAPVEFLDNGEEVTE